MRNRLRRRRSSFETILPYLIIVCVGVIVILVIQIFSAFTATNDDNEIFLSISSGDVNIRSFGTDDWIGSYDGTRILQGDSMRTSQNGRAILSFYDGTMMRLGSDTELSIDELKKDGDDSIFAISLKTGDLWVNKKDAVSTDVIVDMGDIQFKSLGTVFAARNTGEADEIWVIDGRVSVDVFKLNEKSVIDSFEVGVGQQARITEGELSDFREHKSPYILEALSDDFKASAWYLWNTDQDVNPSGLFGSDADDSQADADADEFSDLDAPAKPVILDPGQVTVTTSKPSFKISGTVQEGVSKVVVTHNASGVIDEYTLQRFKLGDTTWEYIVVASQGNMKLGRNTYSVVAVDEAGNKSAPSVLTVNYDPNSLLDDGPAT